MFEQYTYFSIMRPISIGTCPKEGIVTYENFDSRRYDPGIGRQAWGKIIYDRRLTKEEMDDCELVETGSYANRSELELRAGKLLMKAGYSGKEALAAVKAADIEELIAITQEG